MNLLIIYTYIILFGGWILNLFNIPSNTGLYFLQSLDYLPFLILPFVFKAKRNYSFLPNSISFWAIIIIFIIISGFTTIYHQGNILACISHFGAMFRYTPLALYIYLIKPSTSNLNNYYLHLKIITIILLLIGYSEIIGGESIKRIFLPISNTYSSSANLVESSDISGVFPNTIDYAYFLVICYIIISNKLHIKNRSTLFLVFLIPIFYSGSKAALIIFLLCISYQYTFTKAIRNIILFTISIFTIIILYNFWELFYWTVFIDSQASRLGYIIFTFPSFINELSLDTIFGVSPDKTLVFHKINSYPNAPMMTWDIDHMASFEDEFYVALPIFYGVLGFAVIVYLFYSMYRTLINAEWNNNNFNYRIIVKSLFTILIIAPLFNQIIIIKPFSLIFWCFIGILCNNIIDSKTKIV